MTLVAGRYRLDALLGEGGMGEVHRAWDLLLQRQVAVKLVRPLEGVEKDSALREARAAAPLAHANIVAVFDAGEHEERAFVVMEIVDGSSLRAFVGDAAVPVARRIGWLIEIADALATAHDAGLVHRDVKPENVMIRAKDGIAKVLDFGIARWGAPDAIGESIAGTPGYMAPEQLHGRVVDGRADQFAWAVMAAEVLGPDVGAFDTVIARAMENDPAARFGSMRELLALLDPRDASGPVLSSAVVSMAPTEVASGRVAPLRLLDVPLPHSNVPDAIEAYDASRRAFHDGSWAEAQNQLERTVALDPKVGAAWVRLAMLRKVDGVSTREQQLATFRRATDLRRSLAERDRALLQAWSPHFLSERVNPQEIQRLSNELAAAHPMDAEVLVLAAMLDPDAHACEALMRRAIEIDPDYADALGGLGVQLAMHGRLEEALPIFDRSVAASPASADSRRDRAFLLAQLGRTREAEAEARQALALDPNRPAIRELIASTLFERTHNLEAVADVLRKGVSCRAATDAILIILGGDLHEAVRSIDRALLSLGRDDAEGRAALTTLAIETCRELGDVAHAGEVAAGYLEDVDIRPPVRFHLDPLPLCVAAAADAGRMEPAEAARRRADWFEVVRRGGELVAWALAYRSALHDESVRQTAVSVLQSVDREATYRWPFFWSEVGCALYEVGNVDEAIPLLEIAARTPFIVSMPFSHLRAIATLARALEGRGDLEGARLAHSRLLALWDHHDEMRSVQAARR